MKLSVRAGMLGHMSVFGRTLLVTGPESLLGARAANERVRAAQAEAQGAQLNRIEAMDLDGNTLSEVTGGSLFSSDAITVINDLGSTPPELADALVAVAADVPPELCLVLIHGGGAKGKALLDRLKKARLETVEVAAVKPWDLPKFVLAEARGHGMRLTPESAQALVDAVGNDLRALAAAVNQLVSDTDGDVIDVATINRYFAGRAEVTSFQVVDATLAGNATLALERLRWALGTGVAAVLITSAMASGVRGMARYLDARSLRLSDFDLARQIGVPPFKVKDLHRTSKGWTSEGTARALLAVAKADAQVKGAASDPDHALERLVLTVIEQRR